MKRPLIAAALLLTGLPGAGTAADIGEAMASAASAWLDSLTSAQRERAVFPFRNVERENWHYIPRARKGIRLGEMTEAQRESARALVATGLSERGRLQVEAIIALENVLREVENSAGRDPDRYYFTVFGVPGNAGPWGWRVEGHHLSLNFTLANGKVAATPLFFGANPAEVRINHPQKGRRALPEEESLGRALMRSLDTAQRRLALIADRAPAEILTGADREVKPLSPAGIAFPSLNTVQQAQLRSLVEVYTSRLSAELSGLALAKIAAGWERVSFAWAGGTEPGEPHYYRIQGTDFLIEYDNTQDGANHIHTTWRSFEGDFGRDLLREHYLREHMTAR